MPTEEIPRQYRHSDEVETIQFREKTNASLKLVELGQTLMHDCIDRVNQSLLEFKMGQGKLLDALHSKSESHDDRLARIETSLSIMVKVTWCIVACSIGIVMTAVWKIILK